MGESCDLRCNYGLSLSLVFVLILCQYGECFQRLITNSRTLETTDKTSTRVIKLIQVFINLRRRPTNTPNAIPDLLQPMGVFKKRRPNSPDFETLFSDVNLLKSERLKRQVEFKTPQKRVYSRWKSRRRRFRPSLRDKLRYSARLSRKQRWRGRWRRGTSKDPKVFIFGQDNRTPVFPHQTRKFPFSNVVRLSTGCSGTLVTPSFVLTAGHCVHDGHTFRTNIEKLKVEVPAAVGFKIYYVDRISIPLGWLKSKNPVESLRAGFDYAIVKLNIPVLGRQEFMKLFIPDPTSLDSDINFIGFTSYSSDGMWTSRCQASMDMLTMDGNLLLSNCDSVAGNSGAAVFTDGRYGRRIIGVLSNTASANTGNIINRYSIITSFTWSKLLEICTMIGEQGTQYGVCPPFPNTLEWSYEMDDPQQNALF